MQPSSKTYGRNSVIYRAEVNKYDIQFTGSDLTMFSGEKLALVLPEILDLLETATIRYTLSVAAELVSKTGRGARQAVPIIIKKMLTRDQWLLSAYATALERIGWIYQNDPDELATYIAELEAVIDDDEHEMTKREVYTRELAAEIDKSETITIITGDDVLALLENKRAITPKIKNATWSGDSHVKSLAELLYEIDLRANRRKKLQTIVEQLHYHDRTGWQDYRQVAGVAFEFLDQHPNVRQVKIFGSRANRTYRPDSDMDIALVLRVETTEEALEMYRQQHEQWRTWFSEQFPYEIDLNLYVDEETTPEVHNAITQPGYSHQTYGR